MVVELTYGSIENQLTGGGSGGIPVDKAANRNNTLSAFPNLYPDAGVLNTSYYAYQVMQDQKPPIWDGKSINLVPQFSWGSLIGNAPPNIAYPGWLNINQTHDYSASLTKVKGRHTIKAGAYLNHSYKAQNAGFNASFAGNVDFSNNTNNTLDSGFGYSNAALGVFNSYSAGFEIHRRQHALQSVGILRPGQLESEQPPDPGLWDAVRTSAAPVRSVRSGVELLPR